MYSVSTANRSKGCHQDQRSRSQTANSAKADTFETDLSTHLPMLIKWVQSPATLRSDWPTSIAKTPEPNAPKGGHPASSNPRTSAAGEMDAQAWTVSTQSHCNTHQTFGHCSNIAKYFHVQQIEETPRSELSNRMLDSWFLSFGDLNEPIVLQLRLRFLRDLLPLLCIVA